jgi:hypothetical protein
MVSPLTFDQAKAIKEAISERFWPVGGNPHDIQSIGVTSVRLDNLQQTFTPAVAFYGPQESVDPEVLKGMKEIFVSIAGRAPEKQELRIEYGQGQVQALRR